MISTKRTLKGHLGKIYSTRWSSDGNEIISAAQDGRILVWDPFTGGKLYAIALKYMWVMTCDISTSNQLLCSGGLDNVCSIYKRSTQLVQAGDTSRVDYQLRFHAGYISCARFIDDSELITASGDGTCARWDIERESVIQVYRGHRGDVMKVDISPSKNLFASASCDSTIRIWDNRMSGAKGSAKQIFVGHENDINSVVFMHNGFTIASASDDSTCRLFDLRVDRELNVYFNELAKQPFTSVAFSNSGRLLFGGNEDGNIYAWDVLRSEDNSILSGHDNAISGLCVDPKNGNGIVSASWDGNLKVLLYIIINNNSNR